MLQAPGDSDRWFIFGRNGIVVVADTSFQLIGTFVDLRDRMVRVKEDSGEPETGLLGVAFHPDFENNGQVFLYYRVAGRTSDTLTATLSRFSRPDGGQTLDPSSEQELFTEVKLRSRDSRGHTEPGDDRDLDIGPSDACTPRNAEDTDSPFRQRLGHIKSNLGIQ